MPQIITNISIPCLSHHSMLTVPGKLKRKVTINTLNNNSNSNNVTNSMANHNSNSNDLFNN